MKRPLPEGTRNWLVAAVLAAALLAGWWLSREPEPEPEAPPQTAPAGGPVAPPPGKGLPPAQQAAPEMPPPSGVDVFAVRTWEPPPPPPMASAAPAPPQAPTLPFRYMGRIDEPGRPQVFLLLQGERVVRTKVGERIGAWRLEKFEGGQLHFRYRPMNVVQTLGAGSASP